MSLFVDLHVLQSVPVANLNRDDLGSPKTVRYGNADRIRVSSQAWKREIRHGVEADLGEKAARSRLVPNKVKAALEKLGWDAESAQFAAGQVAACAGEKGLKTENAGHTSVLLFLPEAGIADLAALCEAHAAELAAAMAKKPAKSGKAVQVLPVADVVAILKRRTASISLFGRMLPELPGANVDGAAQVAHAMTTHGAEPQRDYFTAVDDWLPEGDTGSGHLNTAEFSAGVFYRFASVNITDLLANLEGDRKLARTVVGSFADHFLMSLPQAKKTSTAPHTLPDLAYLAVREQRPVSLAAAFETPVGADREGGFSGPSRRKLNDYAKDVNRLTGGRGRLFHGYAGVSDDSEDSDRDGLGEEFSSFLGLVEAAVSAAVPETADGQ